MTSGCRQSRALAASPVDRGVRPGGRPVRRQRGDARHPARPSKAARVGRRRAGGDWEEHSFQPL